MPGKKPSGSPIEDQEGLAGEGRGAQGRRGRRKGEGLVGRGRSKDKWQRGECSVWPSLGDRRFDGEGTGRESRGCAVELSLPHPHMEK